MTHSSLSIKSQNRQFIVAVLPVVVVGGAAAFAYITWSQVREKRRIRDAQAAAAKDSPPGSSSVESDNKNPVEKTNASPR